MHRGYEVYIDSNFFKNKFNSLLLTGETRYNNFKINIESTLDSFSLNNGKLDGFTMQNNWFPQIEADIFLSHSHNDKNLAIVFSEWLFQEFGLTVFIDSSIWGYSEELLLEIDKEFSDFNPTKNTYNYNKRNNSTSHVHMMLSAALSMMIDKVECVFFLNTPNSITTNDVILKTESPWIYSEIAMTQIIRKKSINEYRTKPLLESKSYGQKIEKGVNIEHTVNTEHLTSLTHPKLLLWKYLWQGKKTSDDLQIYALDTLYLLN